MSIRILLTTVMIASVLSALPFTMNPTSVAPWTNQALAQGNDSEDINAPSENLQQYSKQSWPQYNDYQKQPVAPQRANPVAPAPQQPQYNQPQYNQPQYNQSQYNRPQPQYNQPQYNQPQYNQSQYNRPQPQYNQPQYNQPQYNQQPQQPQYKQAFVCPKGYTCTRNRPKVKNTRIQNRIRGKRDN